MEFVLTFLLCFITALLITPLVKRFAIKIGATDKPNYRKVHQRIMPRLGGLAIYISFMVGMLVTMPDSPYTWPIMIGGTIIVITGFLDDIFELSAKVKLLGQILAATVAIVGGVYVEFINLPFDGILQLGMFGIPLTLLWIVGVTNAINLIDGLDGLAAGVSSIVLLTITTIAIMDGNMFIVALASILLASTIGFLYYNFHPAKIFMGDTGSLFLGYMISVISLLGFKSVTLFSLLIPIVILAVPISDTLFAIVRRKVNRQPLSAPDKSHLHHCFLRLGYSHRSSVLMIYGISAFFALSAVLLTQSTLWGALIITLLVLFAVELMVELVGLINTEYRPMLNMINRLTNLRRTS
ncbi:undecaprenyl/decaprenyl-phosphate alpha-N-acetylglucosaminyl 1-phosphate transferase [Paenalkalicoccus suaedae]|uniref:Undecaprenyl/decaprenyl-phosphate alpha-N-acetylglucosaminyl 1-phosphate transferase n=1 Tax=Paenalkalicoccus suaedae TaxID=2592382 RepID=A0A859FHU5_9BACI|nr:MraY family glycosyltransferase [Paenalkalicoccus suaedae]QKS72380.1 undecaprenyl/decaprenyl-phosphate alpha-N-acetylglucosaminyl 1-phosphate transferase [Paenalkalicoccus suaedae]